MNISEFLDQVASLTDEQHVLIEAVTAELTALTFLVDTHGDGSEMQRLSVYGRATAQVDAAASRLSLADLAPVYRAVKQAPAGCRASLRTAGAAVLAQTDLDAQTVRIALTPLRAALGEPYSLPQVPSTSRAPQAPVSVAERRARAPEPR